MHHTGRAAIAEHRLVEIGHGHVHGEEAEFLVLDSRHCRPIIGQAAVQAIPEQVKGDSRRVRQRRLLDKMAPVTEIHGVEKRRRLLGALGGSEMVGAVIHEHQAPRAHRRPCEGADDTVGRLVGNVAQRRPLHEDRHVAAGIDDDAC